MEKLSWTLQLGEAHWSMPWQPKAERFSKFKWWKVCISVFLSGEISPFLDKEIGEFWGFLFL